MKNPGGRKPSDPEGDSPKRNIGSGLGRAAASTRRQAIRIALCHELIRAGRLLDRRSMVVANQGNLSARVSSDRFLITRRGRRQGELTTRDFVELGMAEPESSPAALAASVEHRLHRTAYSLRRDVEALLHAQPVALMAYAVRGVLPDLARFDQARDHVGPVGFVPYKPSGTEELAEAVGGALAAPGKPCVILLQNHGALAVGQSVGEALARLEIAEHLAATLLASERR